MPSNLLYSIVVPTCNRNELLSLCLNCLIPEKQGINADVFEIIVTDDSVNAAAKTLIEQKFPRVTWVEGPKRGPASNRNNGARYAKGQWLIFIDDDCYPDKNILKNYSNYISIHKEVKVFEGKIICSEPFTSPLHHAPVNLNGGYLWSCNFLIERRVFFQIGGFDENFKFPHLEDVDFLDRLRKAGYLPVFSPQAFVDHPPRKLATGKRLGYYHESDFYFFQVKRKERLSVIKLLKRTLKVRLSPLIRYRLSKDTLVLLYGIAEEFFVVLRNYRKWQKLYPVTK